MADVRHQRRVASTPHAPLFAEERVLLGLIGHDAQTDVLHGEPRSAICVQRFDDSLGSAIHTTYRSWLRSSSMHEPRDPPLEVVSWFTYGNLVTTFTSSKWSN
eukprot:gene4991-biopygen77